MKQIIVLDMDGTLYNLGDVSKQIFEIQIDFLAMKTGKSRQTTIHYLEDHGIWPEITQMSKSATELFISNGIPATEWNTFRQSRFPFDSISKSTAVKPESISKLCRLGICVLLSSNSYNAVQKILTHLSIPLKVFSAIVCSDMFTRDSTFSKKIAMEDLLCRFSIAPSNLISIGDRFNTDIKPAIELGGSGYLVRDPKAISAVVSEISGHHSEAHADFTYYPIGSAINQESEPAT